MGGKISRLGPQVPMPDAPGPMPDPMAALQRKVERDKMANAAAVYEQMQRELKTYGHLIGDGSTVMTEQAKGLGPISAARMASGDVAPQPQPGSGDRKRMKPASAMEKFRDGPTMTKVRDKVADTLQGVGDTIDYYAGPHASDALGRTGQAVNVGAHMAPIIGDIYQLGEGAADYVDAIGRNDTFGAWKAAGMAGLGLGMFIPIFAGKPGLSDLDNANLSKAQQIWDDAVRTGGGDETADSISRRITQETGLTRIPGSPNQWVKEVQDFDLRPELSQHFRKTGRLSGKWGDIFEGPVTRDEPWVSDVPTRVINDGTMGGAYYPTVSGGPALSAQGPASWDEFSPDNVYRAAGHETQHGLFDRYNYPGGANPSGLPPSIVKAYDGWELPDDALGRDMGIYHASTGEDFSNAVMKRWGWTPEQRLAKHPYDSFDTPPDLQWKRIIEQQPDGTNAVKYGRVNFEGGTDWISSHPVKPAGKVSFAMQPGTELPPDMSVPKKATTPISGLGKFPNTTPEAITEATIQNGGNSVNIPSGVEPQDGLMMGVYRNTDPRNLVVEGQATPDAVQTFFNANKKTLQGEDKYLGTWFNPDDGKTYFDVSRRFEPDDVRAATKFGERTGQLAGFNRGTFDTFPVGNWQDYVNGEDFAKRMTEMNAKGEEYLKKFPTKDWWDMHGTEYTRTYNPDDLPYVAGTTAATAPNMDPRRNIMVASEYMRRKGAGEDIIQPNWRVGDSGGEPAFNAPGGKMPMEQSRKANIERGAAGLPLSGPKIESERQAMLGDPNAVVLDRWWARLGEDPSKGVFTDAQEGSLASENYDTMAGPVRAQAAKEGYNPRTYSANVWTGTREQAKTGELYGQTYKKGSVNGDSKSYADHLTDLINEKASKLGITPDEMRGALRRYERNLMGMLPPVVAGKLIYDALSSDDEELVQ